MKLQELTLRKVRLPLIRPYVLSYRTFTEFEPIIFEVHDSDGRIGWGEGHISPGSAARHARAAGHSAANMLPRSLARLRPMQRRWLLPMWARAKLRRRPLLTAIEMLEGHPLLRIDREVKLALLTPFNGFAPKEIEDEVERRLAEGFHTFKVKVGKDADADLKRVKAIQEAIAGRATMRIDANRAYGEADACRFASALEPSGIELFEQPCQAEDWKANANVAKVSSVPIMLDEPICTLEDVKRAADIQNVGFCKLKLKRFGGLDLLKEALDTVRQFGMEPVLGDGLSSELGCWMEGCVGSVTINNAGEFNGFLKPNVRLFAEPLQFTAGNLVLAPGFTPTIDGDALSAHVIEQQRFVSVRSASPQSGRRRVACND
jgi:L-alanine-DL-glutamate epimerase-like enolase superfamily enzyme